MLHESRSSASRKGFLRGFLISKFRREKKREGNNFNCVIRVFEKKKEENPRISSCNLFHFPDINERTCTTTCREQTDKQQIFAVLAEI